MRRSSAKGLGDSKALAEQRTAEAHDARERSSARRAVSVSVGRFSVYREAVWSNPCSTSPEIGVQLPPDSVFNFLRNTHHS